MFQSFPNFRNVWTSAFLSDTSIQPTSKPKNPCRSDSRIRHFNHSRIFAICEHRLFSSDTSIRPTSKPKNPCRSDSRIRHFNHSRIFAMCEHRLFCRIQVSDLRRNRTIHVGRILESDIPIIPEFLQCMDIGFFVGYKYPTYVETEQSM